MLRKKRRKYTKSLKTRIIGEAIKLGREEISIKYNVSLNTINKWFYEISLKQNKNG